MDATVIESAARPRRVVEVETARGTPLSVRQKLRNKLISSHRLIVEQAFGTLKRKFKMARASVLAQNLTCHKSMSDNPVPFMVYYQEIFDVTSSSRCIFENWLHQKLLVRFAKLYFAV